MEEIWKDIPNYETAYQASNLGRIRSLDRFVRNNIGKRLIRGQILKPVIDPNGYYHVSIKIPNSDLKRRSVKVHRLVADTFLLKIPGKLKINHIDGDKANNGISNLEYCTTSENIKHALATGLQKRRAERINAKLKEDDVTFIREHYGKIKLKDLALKFGVSKSTIFHANRGIKVWHK